MNKTEEFIEKYKHLEAAIRSNYNLKNEISLISFFNSNSCFKPFLEKMRYIQDVRNLLQHKYKIGDEYPFEVSNCLIEELDKLLEIFSTRKRCKDIMLPFDSVYKANINDKLSKVIYDLKDKMYNHVPIMSNNNLIGVFDENDYVDNLILEFDKAYQEGKRIGLVFLNSSGKIDGSFNGIISTSDIVGKIL